MWHYTGNPGASADGHYTYFGFTLPGMNAETERAYSAGEITKQERDQRLRYASANVFIDKTKILVIIPLDEESWHASQANPYSIGIELCIEEDGSFHPETVRNAVEFGKWLSAEWGLKTCDYLRHFDVTGKRCPLPWLDDVAPGAWESFKKAVDNTTDQEEETVNLTTEQWGALAASLSKAYQCGLLGDYRFVEKAYNGTLTRSELDVANNVILVNRSTS
ncbi:N-acetylmuramoyl-L-alanine amidase family protein [Paenibacillus sp. HJGM_3]